MWFPSGLGPSFKDVLPTEPVRPSNGARWVSRSSRSLGRPRTDRQFDCERRRQDLLDQRSRRWCRMIFTLAVSFAIVARGFPVDKAIATLLAMVGLS